jgi:hypothetical protein
MSMPPRVRFRDSVRFGAGVAIPVDPPKAGEPQPNPRWIHTANEGVYDGYPGGGADITRDTLEQIVRNFKADPRFKLGASALGEGRVVPFDIAHISEMDPRAGTPLQNEEAMAWALDVAVRNGPDGKAQLWTYAELGPEIRAAIEAKPPKINYVSIAFTPSAVDPHSGAAIGALMTSVAFTNKPFIRELTPLAASTEAARFLGRYFDPATTPADAVGSIRSLLNMPLAAPLEDVLGSVERIIGWALTGGAPPGVDAAEVLEDVRTILSIPIATPADQILTQVRTVFQTAAGAAPATTIGAKATMNPTLVKLFSLFGIVAQAEGADAALERQAGEAIQLKSKLNEFLKAAGFSDLSDLMGKMPELLKAQEKKDKAEADLATAMKSLSGYQEQEQAAEVAAVMSAHKMPEVARESLALHLRTDPKTFRTKYPLPDATRKHLLSTFAAGRQGEVDPPAAGGAVPVTMAASNQNRGATGEQIDLRTFTGRNSIEKAISYLSTKDAGFAKLPWAEQCKRAGTFCRENHDRLIAM